ncbi:SLAM family member 7-like [Clinocottus analis]|uniref:SLAM family member 7-like n=1 Tax=Clinocottus analis TaxID=304258 RepID=UPI0035C1D239
MRSWVTHLLAVSLLSSCEAQGTRETPVFVKTGDDLLLNVDDVPKDYLIVDWKFNKTVDLVRFPLVGELKVFPNFTGRIEFPGENFSVKLKNLQKADSGVYTARVLTPDGDKQPAEYKVTVQDPVSPVNLSVDSRVSRSSASCTFNVTCSTQDAHISSTFTCVQTTCSQEGGEQAEVTTSGASLQVYLSDSSIICHHSNQVTWTKDFKKIEHVCPHYDDPVPVPVLVIVICVIILLVICVLLVLFFYRRNRGNYQRDNVENTIYSEPAPVNQLTYQSPAEDASGLDPSSIYNLVGPHVGSLELCETSGPALPESVYAQVNKSGQSLNNE